MSLFSDYLPNPDAKHAPPSDLALRNAGSNDAEPIARLVTQRDGGEFDFHLTHIRQELIRSADGDQTDLMLCVAETGGDVVAFARSRYFDAQHATEGRNVPSGWHLAGVIVAPEHRRRGIGLALTRYRLKWIAEYAGHAYYFVNARNRASIDLHTRLGFTELTRDFAFPGVSFTGGEGVFYRIELRA